jgi:hypothetical protein
MLDLPFDLLPVILAHLEHPRLWYTASLVNKSFYGFTVACLYRQISVYSWHKHGKTKVSKFTD